MHLQVSLCHGPTLFLDKLGLKTEVESKLTHACIPGDVISASSYTLIARAVVNNLPINLVIQVQMIPVDASNGHMSQGK